MFHISPGKLLTTYEDVAVAFVFTFWSVRACIDELRAFKAWRRKSNKVKTRKIKATNAS